MTMQLYKLTSGALATQIPFNGDKTHHRLDDEARLWLEEWVEPIVLQGMAAG